MRRALRWEEDERRREAREAAEQEERWRRHDAEREAKRKAEVDRKYAERLRMARARGRAETWHEWEEGREHEMEAAVDTMLRGLRDARVEREVHWVGGYGNSTEHVVMLVDSARRQARVDGGFYIGATTEVAGRWLGRDGSLEVGHREAWAEEGPSGRARAEMQVVAVRGGEHGGKLEAMLINQFLDRYGRLVPPPAGAATCMNVARDSRGTLNGYNVINFVYVVYW